METRKQAITCEAVVGRWHTLEGLELDIRLDGTNGSIRGTFSRPWSSSEYMGAPFWGVALADPANDHVIIGFTVPWSYEHKGKQVRAISAWTGILEEPGMIKGTSTVIHGSGAVVDWTQKNVVSFFMKNA